MTTYLLCDIRLGVPPHEGGEEGDHGVLLTLSEGGPHQLVEPPTLGIRVHTQEQNQTIEVWENGKETQLKFKCGVHV